MKKILVANRGEIALRIMRSAREMGIATVAVFSEADRKMPFVRFADEAFCIGPAPSGQSYLVADKIIQVAKECGADAIHPGYGFLSENAVFAQKVQETGLVFIGPSPRSIAMMGNKLAAKQAARKVGVPMVPGTEKPLQSVEEALQVVQETGLPILIKAAAGGGGKGMRVVNHAHELEEQVRLAQSEAYGAFGDDTVFIEKYIASPKHIEVQVLADQAGNYVYLFERECSIQRRHQKLIEEAPSSCIPPLLRDRIGECALAVAKACGYYGAGTVEFLVDAAALSQGDEAPFYFLEMNTRLQVEHPVTEWITGLDLVKEQISIARGEKLSFSQNDLQINGHAIELRICAEDPANLFLPETGRLEIYRKSEGPYVRVDDGYDEGLEVPIHYDPLLAKLTAWGHDRGEAIHRLLRAIEEYEIAGVQTTLPFGKWALQQEAFANGTFDTHFIERFFDPACLRPDDDEAARVAALLAVQVWENGKNKNAVSPLPGNAASNWKRRRSQQ